VKLSISIFVATFLPASAMAGVAGDWAGILNVPNRPLHVVLHLSGPDNALKATLDSPDQGSFGMPVRTVSLEGSTLQFSIPISETTFSGDVVANSSR